MRMTLILLLGAGLAYNLWRQLKGTPSEAFLAVIAVPFVALSFFEYRQQQLVSKLEKTASVIAGHRVKVKCQSIGESILSGRAELGWVYFNEEGEPANITEIQGKVCDQMGDYMRSDHQNPNRDEVVAVHTLAHEAQHLAGFAEEDAAECYSLQVTAFVAERLGATRSQAAALASRYYDEIYPNMPSEYVSSECKDGGTLDLRKRDPLWPTAATVPL